jgi:hypothetical protein
VALFLDFRRRDELQLVRGSSTGFPVETTTA